jgi:hypothetical protein
LWGSYYLLEISSKFEIWWLGVFLSFSKIVCSYFHQFGKYMIIFRKFRISNLVSKLNRFTVVKINVFKIRILKNSHLFFLFSWYNLVLD